MKITHFILPLLLFTFIFACKPAEVAIDDSLHAPAMAVKGRQGLQIGQVIRYGDFTTSKVRRGWTSSYDVPFVVRFRGAKEKLSFTQFGPNGMQAEVSAVSKFNSKEINLVHDYFSVPMDLENFFAGSISFDNGRSAWDFILYNPNGDFLRDRSSAGYAGNDSQRIDIQAIRGLKGQPEWMKKLTIFGHEFLIDGKVVGAVSTVNKGTVWIDPNLEDETKTVIAAVATGLLLRTDVEEAAVDQNL